MAESKEFIAFVNRLKTLSPNITEEQRIGLLRQGIHEYNLTTDEADGILKTSGLVVGEQDSYFDVLGISIEDLEGLSETDIVAYVESVHAKLYRTSLNAGGRPRTDGRTEEEWRTLLNQTRDKLIDPVLRNLHVSTIQLQQLPIDKGNTHQSSDKMVLIPEGEFQMGSDDFKANKNEKPVHTVYVDAFYIDTFPVTNLQYKLFLDANPQWKTANGFDIYKIRKLRDRDYLKTWVRNKFPDGKEDHPVTWVSWYAAMAYAQWLGKRLPTEAEWEKAARGGLVGKKYPWGNSVDKSSANFGSNIGETTPIGNYPANGYEVYDMVGNVYEWCLDQWDEGFYHDSPSINPVAGGSIESIIETQTNPRKKRVIRGCSWYSSVNNLRISYRTGTSPRKTASVVGFRCVNQIYQ
ncbi:hypothetical protein C6497_06430 [Candidatus Poribacteria bacterium]|nr:MAG: hypothetical protein C6497_06430 [Candidatus Poribacteria bacterium]